MYTVSLNGPEPDSGHGSDLELDLEKIDEVCHYIPSDRDVWEGRKEKFDLTELKCYRSLKDSKRLARSISRF